MIALDSGLMDFANNALKINGFPPFLYCSVLCRTACVDRLDLMKSWKMLPQMKFLFETRSYL